MRNRRIVGLCFAAGMGWQLFFVLSIVPIMTMIPALTEACVTKRVIDSLESPTFEGLQFGPVGRYERLVGRFKGYTIVWRRSVQIRTRAPEEEAPAEGRRVADYERGGRRRILGGTGPDHSLG